MEYLAGRRHKGLRTDVLIDVKFASGEKILTFGFYPYYTPMCVALYTRYFSRVQPMLLLVARLTRGPIVFGIYCLLLNVST